MKAENFDLSRDEWERIIHQFIFNETHRRIIIRRLLDGICFEPLAEEFGLSVQQTKTIVYKCEKRLFAKIK